MLTFTAIRGDLVYLDTFAGLVPCKIEAVTDRGITVKITATRGAYKRGSVERHNSPGHVLPRAVVSRSRQHCGQFRIRPFSWAAQETVSERGVW
jgi:hypothetical protein